MNIDNILRRGENRTFWLFHFLFWFAHFLFFMIVEYPQENAGKWLQLYVLFYVMSFFVALIIRYTFLHFEVHRFPLLASAIVIVLFGLICGQLVEMGARVIYYFIYESSSLRTSPTVIDYMHSVWYKSYPYIAYGVIYVLIKIRINLSEQRDKSERSDLLSREAQLNLLRYQINPHFLFNVLNSIRALVKERKDDAENMISELSEFMKFSLYTRKRKEVPLIEELEMLDHYFRIEKIRFDENLVVKQDIDPLSEEFPVPPLILQPIIENAIKYGNQTAQPPLVIEINTRVEEQTLTIEISNTGKWVDERKKNSENGKRMGTGIENITSRLKFLYPDKHAFSIQKDNAKVTVHIEITKEFGKENYEEDESITR